jgi:hypothetical protein
MTFAWRKWKLGFAVSSFMALIVAGAGLVSGMQMRSFIAVLCAALLTNLGSFLKDHPVDDVSFDDDQKTNSMKKVLSIFIVAALGLSFIWLTAGCTKTTTATVGANGATNVFTSYTMNPAVLAGVTDVLAYGTKLGAQAGMQKSPNVRPYLQAVEVELSSAVNSGAYDESTLTNALNHISIGEIKNDTAVVELIDHVQGLAAMALGSAAQKGFAKADFIQPMLSAVDTGLRAALATP